MKNNDVKSGQLKLDKQRRNFIKRSTLLGAGVASAVALPVSAFASASASDEPVKPERNQGYRLTAHIAEYYKSAAS